jgi:ammonia channel protein AmtB
VVYNLGDIAWEIAATALVWIMIPGVGFFYSGLLRRKNALSMIWLSMMTLAVVSFQVSLCFLFLLRRSLTAFLQWFFWGCVYN